MAALLCSLTLCQARQHWPCHQRAIHSGLKRSQRTPTDNTMAPVSCGGPHLSRSRSRRIWLCKQEVAGSNLAVPTTSYGCLADGTTHKQVVLPIL